MGNRPPANNRVLDHIRQAARSERAWPDMHLHSVAIAQSYTTSQVKGRPAGSAPSADARAQPPQLMAPRIVELSTVAPATCQR